MRRKQKGYLQAEITDWKKKVGTFFTILKTLYKEGDEFGTLASACDGLAFLGLVPRPQSLVLG